MSVELVSLSTIFEVLHGNKFDFNKMSKCASSENSIAFIRRSRERNGFVGFVEKYENKKPYEAGLITVALGGSALSSFVQPRPFYTAQNIDVLRPLVPMSLDVKLYYCLCIEANQFRYSTYGREANRTLKNIQVPAISSIPSWVSGASRTAVSNFSNELMYLVETEEAVTVATQPKVVKDATSSTTETVARSIRPIGLPNDKDEDSQDAEIARERLKQIEANPKRLISGAELDEKLDELQS